MFSLQKLLGKNKEFFELLEGSAQQCCNTVEATKQLLEFSSESARLQSVKSCRLENKRIFESTSELLVRTFVTVLEREDIESIASSLYRIPKPLEKFSERFVVLNTHVTPDMFAQQIKVVDTAASTVLRMVRELAKGGGSLAKIKGFNNRLQQLEAEADDLELALLRDLFTNSTDALKIIVVKDLYDLLEKVVDRCRDAGNVITNVFLKNS